MKQYIGYIAVLVLGAAVGLFLGNILFSQEVQQVAVGSPTGSTFGTAKIASVVMAPSTASASSTAIVNPDASDRLIESAFADCNTVGTSKSYLVGSGLSSTGFRLNIATSSAGTQTGNANAFDFSIATATPDRYATDAVATSSVSDFIRVWKAGSYLQFTFSATNTASCVVGVHYLAS